MPPETDIMRLLGKLVRVTHQGRGCEPVAQYGIVFAVGELENVGLATSVWAIWQYNERSAVDTFADSPPGSLIPSAPNGGKLTYRDARNHDFEILALPARRDLEREIQERRVQSLRTHPFTPPLGEYVIAHADREIVYAPNFDARPAPIWRAPGMPPLPPAPEAPPATPAPPAPEIPPPPEIPTGRKIIIKPRKKDAEKDSES